MKNVIFAARLSIFLFAAAAASAFLASCQEVPDLSEYQGINYIANHNFSSGSWSFDDTMQGAYHYMGFNSDSAGTAAPPAVAVFTGLPGNADSGDISRLEIFNLVPDGGFESGTAGWAAIGGASIAQEDEALDLNDYRVHDDVGNNSLYYNIPSATDIIRYDLSNLLDNFLPSKKYLIRLYFTRATTNDTALFEYNGGSAANIIKTWKPKTETGWIADSSAFTKFPDLENLGTNMTAQTGYYFCIGSYDSNESKTQTGYIDDFRIVRSDIDYYLRMSVPFSGAGRPDLYSGIYRFSVYFKGEDAADITPAVNRFRSSRVSLVIDGKKQGFSTASYSNSGWTRLEVEKFIQIYPGGTIEIMVSPADSSGLENTLDIGSVLIASPSLYFISD